MVHGKKPSNIGIPFHDNAPRVKTCIISLSVYPSIKKECSLHARLQSQHDGNGTRNFLHEAAMTEEEMERAINIGCELV
ncbi:MAG: nicotinate-nucleotide--dimethylbenzimidazole phosphoribosyltransferase, partial [Schwartzia sp.]|nr:nicotinate-nucleotide--dimethylbenzimidazole phosphoribosyltransferase [Schwartzia sp. (in: firmicutes)]